MLKRERQSLILEELQKEKKVFPKKADDKIPPIGDDTIRIIPLGGVEEVGRNMTVVETEEDILIVDAGFQFVSEETPGIDYILPNIQYLEERKDKIRALLVTHGHLDHIKEPPFLGENIFLSGSGPPKSTECPLPERIMPDGLSL